MSGKLYYKYLNLHTKLSPSQTTKSPVKIINIHEKEDTIFVNQTNSIVQANHSDVNFECLPQPTLADPNNTIPDAIRIKLTVLNNLSGNQKGNLTLGGDPPKEVLKYNGVNGFVKENCVPEDINGSSTIHIWDQLLSKL